jgi:nicotinamidase-related amidase
MPSTNPIRLPCRYYRVYTDLDVPCIESNFHFVERDLPLPVHETALVLVDVWRTHYIDSWLQRAGEVTNTNIVPILQAARDIDMTIIHAPSPPVADRYAIAPESDQPSPSGPDWPPSEFRGIYRSGDYAAFGRNQEPILPPTYERYKTELDIAEVVKPLPNESVIHTGPQMHALLADRKILHLIYVGFATNWCVIGRDYGIIAMNKLGYNIILVRDATTGIEFHDTIDHLTATEITIREVETKYSWSTTTEAFTEACKTNQS